MIAALITVASVLGYLTPTLVAARWRYRAIRPYTEPVRCEYPRVHTGRRDHHGQCYRRNDSTLIDTRTEATVFALLTGLAWPFILPAIAVTRLIMAGDRQLPEEMAANIKRLEAENERLRRQQDTAR